jgi:hypothetical protein
MESLSRRRKAVVVREFVRRGLVPPVSVNWLRTGVIVMSFVAAGARPFSVTVERCKHNLRAEFLDTKVESTATLASNKTNCLNPLQDPEWAPLAPYLCAAEFSYASSTHVKIPEEWKAALTSHAPVAAMAALFDAVKECVGVVQLRAALAAAAPLGLRAQPMVAWWRRRGPWHLVSYAAAKGTLPVLWTVMAWDGEPDQMLRDANEGYIIMDLDAVVDVATLASDWRWAPWPVGPPGIEAAWTAARAAWAAGWNVPE